MSIQTDIHFEVTDTFCGEANYSWVKRGKIEMSRGKDYSDLSAVRKVKKAIGWNGLKCKTENDCEGITIRPQGLNMVCFISFYSHGRAS